LLGARLVLLRRLEHYMDPWSSLTAVALCGPSTRQVGSDLWLRAWCGGYAKQTHGRRTL